jgi:hypothetical protein
MDFTNINKKEFLYPCDNQISCYPFEVFLPAGVYLIECYGASGGTSGGGKGGYGAYVSGYIKLSSIKQMFLFIGAQGHLTVGKPSFNGGGRGHLYYSKERGDYVGTSGGGSTDIRLKNSTELDGLVSRIIVAGAGGGGESCAAPKGGDAGIFYGENGTYLTACPTADTISSSEGANVSVGGSGGQCITHRGGSCSINYHGHSGGFGFGGSATDDYYGSGGGSGYFGGGGGAVSYCLTGSGAGGSSYISGYKGFHTFTIENGALKDTNSENHTSGLIFDRIYVKNGTETEYVGNGKIIITKIKLAGVSCNNQSNNYCYIVYASLLVLLS